MVDVVAENVAKRINPLLELIEEAADTMPEGNDRSEEAA